MKNFKKLMLLTCLIIVSACIKNDIPYPYIVGEFTYFTIEGQIGASVISPEERRVQIQVSSDMDLANLKVDSVAYTEDAIVTPDPYEVVDFTVPVKFTISTYQDYDWEVNVVKTAEPVVIDSVEIEGMISSTVIAGSKTVRVIMPKESDLSNLGITLFDYTPSTASVSPDPYSLQDFTSTVTFTFNEDDQWFLEVTKENNVDPEPGEQVEYSDFTTWFWEGSASIEKNRFYLPGENMGSPWRSGDKGAADLTFKTYPQTVLPYPSMEQADYAVLETKTAVGVIAAGSLFVGDIQGSGPINITTDFGIPFTDRPIGFTTDVQYNPETYGDNVIDQCDIYVILQVREGEGENEKRYRLATGWYRSSSDMPDFTTLDLPLLYGQHQDLESYMMPSSSNKEMPEHGFYEDITASPTHIIMVFASSAEGASFKGGIGSTLKVKGITLNY
ncbi:PCMD domain-containing protein [Flammeovirga sp. SubArs3]|uniref:PCMD domain-containing protein n=1 Tax=Flammeovirga sp. SubArs3 TaxID=2995316 RepID=UPI00248C73E5|nr:PCMD domain-containing protein [Flammeovirga sp. SubArs3]